MSKKILVVEDDPKSMTLTRDMLTASGYKSIKANNGEEGVELAKKEKPDLILMDIMMPKLDGYGACNQIKHDPSTTNIPVVMLTAVGFELNKRLAGEMGANGYITKPFSRQELVRVISPLLG